MLHIRLKVKHISIYIHVLNVGCYLHNIEHVNFETYSTFNSVCAYMHRANVEEIWVDHASDRRLKPELKILWSLK
jgi:hypothetical protein